MIIISNRKLRELENRIYELERKTEVNLWDWGRVNFPEFARKIEREITNMKKAASGN